MDAIASAPHADGPRCVLPNCRNGVERWGEPCQDCRTAFGARLRPTCAPALTREQIAERDRDVVRALALHQQAPPRPRRRSA
ncbi:MAG: hypothetical protein U1D00_28225 [Mycobacterium sp.]|nr:hypothetical protein [Mycobacterium sp.]